MLNLGIILDHLGPSQLAYYTLMQANQGIDDYEFFLFAENIQPLCLPPKVACMDVAEIYGLRGLLIATSLSGAERLIQLNDTFPRIFYIWDLEWLRPNNNNFLHNINIYRHPKLKLVARSNDHALEIANYTNIQPHVIEHFNIQEIVNKYGRLPQKEQEQTS